MYGFDTGFVCYHRGWYTLRRDDFGSLWEHYVLNELQGRLQARAIRYWRDKQGHEVDFVIASRGRPPVAIECKWSAEDVDPRGLKAFQRRYPKSECRVVSGDVETPYQRRYGNITVEFVGLDSLVNELVRTQ